MDKEEINVKSESVSAGIPNNSRAGVPASSANRDNDQRILNASTRQKIVSPNSADTENDKIGLRGPIAHV